MSKFIALSSSVLIIFQIARTDDIPGELDKWIALAPPSGDDWIVATEDIKHEWVVTLQNGQPRAKLYNLREEAPLPLPFEIKKGTYHEGLSGRRLSVKVEDGWLIAFEAGEFGAGLWWFSTDGKTQYKLGQIWIKGFIETNDSILAIEWTPLGRDSKGRVIKFVRNAEGRWQTEGVVDLKDKPEVAMKLADGAFLVATTKRLLRIDPITKAVVIVIDNAFWDGLFPNSLIVAQDERIYIGMRHGITRIEKRQNSYNLIWLLPNKEFIEMKSEEVKFSNNRP